MDALLSLLLTFDSKIMRMFSTDRESEGDDFIEEFD